MTLSAPFTLSTQVLIDELDAALGTLEREVARQRRMLAEFAEIYSEVGEASSLSAMVQGIYTKAESILKNLVEAIDGKVSPGGAWQAELLNAASAQNPGVRYALISHSTYKAMQYVLGFRHVVRSHYSEEIRISRAREMATETVSTMRSLIGELRHFLSPIDGETAKDKFTYRDSRPGEK